jgi:hypothetical protein
MSSFGASTFFLSIKNKAMLIATKTRINKPRSIIDVMVNIIAENSLNML